VLELRTEAQDDDIVTGQSDVADRVVEEWARRCLGEGRGGGTGIPIRRFECLGKVYNVPHEPKVLVNLIAIVRPSRLTHTSVVQ
jgi:hypothetical protein